MNHIDKCRVCENYLRGLDKCKYCHFEWSSDYPPTIDVPFDIFDLEDDVEWVHLQILDRLHYKKIDCLYADMWVDDLVILIGCHAKNKEIADALHIHEEVVYRDDIHDLIILNLFQEKYLRGELEDGE